LASFKPAGDDGKLLVSGSGGALQELTISRDQYTKEGAIEFAKEAIGSGGLLLAESNSLDR
jgi:hypothetical protein